MRSLCVCVCVCERERERDSLLLFRCWRILIQLNVDIHIHHSSTMDRSSPRALASFLAVDTVPTITSS